MAALRLASMREDAFVTSDSKVPVRAILETFLNGACACILVTIAHIRRKRVISFFITYRENRRYQSRSCHLHTQRRMSVMLYLLRSAPESTGRCGCDRVLELTNLRIRRMKASLSRVAAFSICV